MGRALALVAVLGLARGALGEEPPPDPSRGEGYGSPLRGPTWKDDALEVPRLVLAVPRLILRILFWPLGAMVRWMDKERVYQRVISAITSRDGLVGIRPELSAVTGYRTTVGVSIFDQKILGPGTALEGDIGGSIGHVLYTHLHFRPTRLGKPVEYDIDLDYRQRDDYFYAGIGWFLAMHTPGSRYGMKSFTAGNRVRLWPSRWVSLQVGGDFVARRFFDGETSGDDPPVSTVQCVRRPDGVCIVGSVDGALMPGFHQGAQYLRGFAGFTVDGMDSPFRPSHGASFDFQAAYAHGLGFDDESWFRFHGDLVAAIDLWRRSRTLLLRVSADALVPTSDALIPFSELVQLGGPDDLRGVKIGKFRDYSSLLATAEYRWPIWMWMDASVFVDYGGVFGKGWSNFDLGHMITDFGLALRLRTASRLFFRGQLAYGLNEGFYFYFAASTSPL